jgi:NAD(P)-dependent dehydrogenase (short-subunit alcohol dehydrogenase family)
MKHILVTGGNKGIGLETSRELARRGCVVHLAGRSEIRVEQAVQDLRREGL